MHLYECRFCKEQDVVELYSWHYLLPNKRAGIDYYHCTKCGKNYVLVESTCELNGFPILTDEPHDKFLKRYLLESMKDFVEAIEKGDKE